MVLFMLKLEELKSTFRLNRSDIEEALLNLRALASIPAPPLKEEKRRDKFISILKKNQITNFEVDDFGNVLLSLNATADFAPILITTNLDSAFDESLSHTVSFSSDKVMGPGVGENCIALAILPILYKHLKDHEDIFNRNIIIAATTGGLGNGDYFGMRGIIKKYRNKIKNVITLRGIDFGKVGYQSPAISRQIIIIRTKNVKKEAINWLNNPITILGAFMKELHNFQDSQPGITQINISFIRGGLDFDGVPSIGSLGIEIIAEEENALFAVENAIALKLRTLIREECDYNIEVISSVLPGGIDKNDKIIEEIKNIYKWISVNDKIPVKFHLAYSTSEATIPMSQDIKTVELGITSGVNNRYLDDYIYLKPVLSGMKQVLFLTHFLNSQLEEK